MRVDHWASGSVCALILVSPPVSSVFSLSEEAAAAVAQQTALQVHRPEVPGQEQNAAQRLPAGIPLCCGSTLLFWI